MKERVAGVRMPGGALDPSAAVGDPPKAPRVRVIARTASRTPVSAAGRRERHSGRVLHAILAVCALLLLAVGARAEALRAEFSPLTLRPRTGAPAIFDLKIIRQGGGLLEGTLEITFSSGREVLFRQSIPDLALTAGAQSFRIVTPPFPQHGTYYGTEARLRFVAKSGASDLGSFPVEGERRGSRNSVIAICDGRGSGGRDPALWQSLRLDGLFPAFANVGNVLATSPVFLAPEDFPANPLALFAFDVVLLDGDGLALLREKQLAALTRWVEAGGSVCVLPAGGLKDEHVRFLDGFADAKNPAPTRLSDTGEWQPGDAVPRRHRAGLGRVVIARRPAGDALGGTEWKRAAAFLWKMRGTITEQFLAGTASVPSKIACSVPSKIAWEDRSEEGTRRQRIDQFLQPLLPRSTRLIAPGTIALILGGFLLVVGPLDWFVLGALRRRRWTWVVFPLAAAGCTLLVIEAAGRALGREDHRSALIVTDVGPGGRVLRENRFELLLTARNRDTRTEFRNAFAIPAVLGTGRFNQRGGEGNAEPVAFSGQMPARYAMRQQLRQWTPQFNRVTSLDATAAPDEEIPWAEIDTLIAGKGDRVAKLREMFRQRKVRAGWLFHGESVTEVASSPEIDQTEDKRRRSDDGSENRVPNGRVGVDELCRGPKAGQAGFFSGSSPDASGDADDLPLLDPGDPHECLLVISRTTPDGVHLYRRLFRTDD